MEVKKTLISQKSLKFFKKNRLIEKLIGDTIYKKFFRIYFFIILVGAICLFLPFSLNEGWEYKNGAYIATINNESKRFGFTDAIFTASSAFSDTGLITNNTNEVFSYFGQAILLILIQFGGLGFLAIITLFWSFMTSGTKYTFEQRVSMNMERGNNSKNSSHRIILIGFTWVLFSELIGWICLTIFFYFATPEKVIITNNGASSSNVITTIANTVSEANTGEVGKKFFNCENFKGNLGLSIWAGLFHVVSAANNAGFDIMGEYSIQPYRNDVNNILSVILLIQFVIGGIGYPVLYDVYLYIKARKTKKEHKFSLFTKIAVLSYASIAMFGIIFVLLFELSGKNIENLLKAPASTGNTKANITSVVNIASSSPTEVVNSILKPHSHFTWGNNKSANKIWNLIFVSFSSRSAGFSSIDIIALSTQTKFILTILMFIGASPASTGGGIRTVTFFIIIIRLIFTSIGRKHITIFKKSIRKEQTYEAFLIYIVATLLLVLTTVIIFISTSNFKNENIIDILFEGVSAFGTTGLSTGVTKYASQISRFGLIFLMFVGQLGVSNTLLCWKKQRPKNKNLRYSYEDVKLS